METQIQQRRRRVYPVRLGPVDIAGLDLLVAHGFGSTRPEVIRKLISTTVGQVTANREEKEGNHP